MPTTNPTNSTLQASRVRELVDDTRAAVAAASKVRTELEASQVGAQAGAAQEESPGASITALEQQTVHHAAGSEPKTLNPTP